MSNSNTFPYASVGFSRGDFVGTCADQPADLHVSCLTIIFAYPTEISYLLCMLLHQLLCLLVNSHSILLLVFGEGPKISLTY
uniref:Putative ovule protein n=1 Tax=Solanum chacoense TaxID=4108 RepID=A0A0V0H3L2_SOLCH